MTATLVLAELENRLDAVTGRLRNDVLNALRVPSRSPSTSLADTLKAGGTVTLHIAAGNATVDFPLPAEPLRVPDSPRRIADNLSPIIDLFTKASGKLKHPKIHFTLPDGKPLSLAVAGAKARFPGSINLSDGGPYGRSKWYGRIHKDGRLEKSNYHSDESVYDFLQAIADDPAGVAAAHGRRTGNCCFCHTTLTDARSVSVGYGPVCAESFGLPWGVKSN